MSSAQTTSIGLSKTRRDKFRRALLRWAKSNLRDFPWRRTDVSPYGVLIAELLLKRTTATSAARLYGSFIERFPSINALATASERTLAETLVPVGLSEQRARAIKELAISLTQQQGDLPTSLDDLRSLPGIGNYAARAILSFGFDVPVAVVDGNVERVMSRVFHSQPEIIKNNRRIQEAINVLLSRRRHRDFNFALLDLGALICRPANPLCKSCPLRRQCDYVLNPQGQNCESPLRMIRKQKGLSLQDVARKAGVTKLTVINAEAGRTTPKNQTLIKIAGAMGVPVESIAPS